jgi:hypothetical protein
MFNKKSQAGLEFMISITLIILVTTIISISMFHRDVEIVLKGRAISVFNNCEEFSNGVTQTIKLNGLRKRFYNYYNLTIDGSARLVVSEYEDGVIFCDLLTPSIMNLTGSRVFNMTSGEYYITNNDGIIVVNQV